ncbi:MAG: hypothetical protein CVV64_17195 [Candidatus Wallbacteria bacterium HGW-Wallbacteria-1]|uniref:Thioredoxin domain-containing protein n=1 Tax=Candidatus Wallbacteria bacterium HGW-Wallbacteria-1 TaxID=2013854 RepID=A0A2N1PKH1_9BACT|nr:MAG: hypothetical protein CVV64_17195 [Candidatus Wallbacteria bacterium HGW-Wallbacteria-1]
MISGKYFMTFLLVCAIAFSILTLNSTPVSAQTMIGQNSLAYNLDAIVKSPVNKANLIVFYTTACPVCEDFFNEFLKIEKKLPAGLEVHLIAMDSDMETVRKHALKKGFLSPVLHDPGRELARRYGGRTTPFLVMNDGSGKIQYTGGSLSADELIDMTGKLVQATGNDNKFTPLFKMAAPVKSPG